MRKQATIPQPKEHQVQAEIVDVLRLCGFVVQETTAYRQKGPSGVDKGVPDLLVWVPGRPFAIGIEVKRDPKARITLEQLIMINCGFYKTAWSVQTALDVVENTMLELGLTRHLSMTKIKAIREALRSGN